MAHESECTETKLCLNMGLLSRNDVDRGCHSTYVTSSRINSCRSTLTRISTPSTYDVTSSRKSARINSSKSIAMCTPSEVNSARSRGSAVNSPVAKRGREKSSARRIADMPSKSPPKCDGYDLSANFRSSTGRTKAKGPSSTFSRYEEVNKMLQRHAKNEEILLTTERRRFRRNELQSGNTDSRVQSSIKPQHNFSRPVEHQRLHPLRPPPRDPEKLPSAKAAELKGHKNPNDQDQQPQTDARRDTDSAAQDFPAADIIVPKRGCRSLTSDSGIGISPSNSERSPNIVGEDLKECDQEDHVDDADTVEDETFTCIYCSSTSSRPSSDSSSQPDSEDSRGCFMPTCPTTLGAEGSGKSDQPASMANDQPHPMLSINWQHSGVLTNRGAEFYRPCSDVLLKVPRNAIPGGKFAAVPIFVAVCADLARLQRVIKLAEDELFCSPFVEYWISKDFKFRTRVSVTLPCFLPSEYNPDDVIVYHISRHGSGELRSAKLERRTPEDSNKPGSYFIVHNSNTVEVFTDHFSGFCVTCKAKVKHKPQLFVSGSATKTLNNDVDVEVVIWDERIKIADFRQLQDLPCGTKQRLELLPKGHNKSEIMLTFRGCDPKYGELKARVDSSNNPMLTICKSADFTRFQACKDCTRSGRIEPVTYRWAMEYVPGPLPSPHYVELAVDINHKSPDLSSRNAATTTLLLKVNMNPRAREYRALSNGASGNSFGDDDSLCDVANLSIDDSSSVASSVTAQSMQTSVGQSPAGLRLPGISRARGTLCVSRPAEQLSRYANPLPQIDRGRATCRSQDPNHQQSIVVSSDRQGEAHRHGESANPNITNATAATGCSEQHRPRRKSFQLAMTHDVLNSSQPPTSEQMLPSNVAAACTRPMRSGHQNHSSNVQVPSTSQNHIVGVPEDYLARLQTELQKHATLSRTLIAQNQTLQSKMQDLRSKTTYLETQLRSSPLEIHLNDRGHYISVGRMRSMSNGIEQARQAEDLGIRCTESVRENSDEARAAAEASGEMMNLKY